MATEHTTGGDMSRAELADSSHTQPSTILRLTLPSPYTAQPLTPYSAPAEVTDGSRPARCRTGPAA